MRHAVVASFLVPILLPLSAPAARAQNGIGTFDRESDIGRVTQSGSTSFDAGRQTYLITGGGQNMWADHDDFHFVWTRLTGNFVLSARARFVGSGGVSVPRSSRTLHT